MRDVPALRVYGAGRVGLAVARLARRRGVEVGGVWNPRPLSPARAALAEGLALEVEPDPRPGPAAAWLIAVPDDAIEDVAGRLAAALTREGPRPRVAAHCAGGRTVDALEALAAAGVPCGGWHPAMTFRGAADDADALARARVAVEGEGEVRRALESLAGALGLVPVPVARDRKPRYHAALVLAANGRVALDHAARSLLAEAGLDPGTAGALLTPLVERTEANLREAPDHALTGPVARGDARTVRAQVEALADRPGLARLYRALGEIQLGMVPGDAWGAGHDEVARLIGTRQGGREER